MQSRITPTIRISAMLVLMTCMAWLASGNEETNRDVAKAF